MVGQGELGYPVDKHTNLVGRDNDSVAASDLTARLKRPAMVKPPRYEVQEVEVVGMGRMMPFAWAKLPILYPTLAMGLHHLQGGGLLVQQLPTGCTYMDWLRLRGLRGWIQLTWWGVPRRVTLTKEFPSEDPGQIVIILLLIVCRKAPGHFPGPILIFQHLTAVRA